MKPFAFLVSALAICPLLAADESDRVMPAIVKKAAVTVEVFMRYSRPDGECFPDRSARVRMIGGAVMIADFVLYSNRTADVSEGLVAFKQDGKWGACDGNGKVIIAPQFETGFSFHSGLAGIRRDGKYGFIDKSARWVIEPQYDIEYPSDFIGEVCAVRIGGQNAVIDRTGRYVWEPGLVRADSLAGGISIETAGGKRGFLDDKGSLIPKGEPNRNYYKVRWP